MARTRTRRPLCRECLGKPARLPEDNRMFCSQACGLDFAIRVAPSATFDFETHMWEEVSQETDTEEQTATIGQ